MFNMAEITGPISTLPGARHRVPNGTKCDEHPNRIAVARVQGETDSMGAELYDLCQECLDRHKAEMVNADTSGTCDWCKSFALHLRNKRDYEEGMSGRVYQICDACNDCYNKRIAEEMAAYDDWGD
jgi:hypothetical protein